MERSSIRGGQGKDASEGRPGRDGNKREQIAAFSRWSAALSAGRWPEIMMHKTASFYKGGAHV